jgi:hypothetical protein
MGKLGVSNAVLDKPGKLDADEWAAVQRHARYTESILSRIDAFGELARVSGAITSVLTARAIREACRATPFRWKPASSRRPTSLMRLPRSAPTGGGAGVKNPGDHG